MGFINLISPSDIIAFLSLLLGTIAYVKPNLVYRQAYIPLYKEQLEKIYTPMYQLLLPYMFKDTREIPIDELIENLLEISNKNLSSVNFSLLNRLEIHNRNKFTSHDGAQENFNSICKKVCQNFDSCRNYLGFKKRTIYYIGNHHQFMNKFTEYSYILYLVARQFIILLILMTPILYIFWRIGIFPSN